MRIIIIGYGVVGQSFTQLLIAREKEIIEKFGIKPTVVAIVDRKGAAIREDGLSLSEILACKKSKGSVSSHKRGGVRNVSGIDVIEAVDADVVVETTITNIKDGEPGLSHIRKAMKWGRHVITTNKGPLAVAMPILLDVARVNGVIFKFSGTVGGGMPVLDFAKRCLGGDEIVEIRGILNGTTNYMLSTMEKGLSYDAALKNAQRLGYAEANPYMDVDGIDAAVKLVILTNWILKNMATLKDVDIEGIRGISKDDFIKAAKDDCRLKLIGTANSSTLSVKPMRIPNSSPLSVEGALNAVTLVSKYAGEETIVGKGAGGMETASAIFRDLIYIKTKLLNDFGAIPLSKIS
jgi:homoserine dehydrogenase